MKAFRVYAKSNEHSLSVNLLDGQDKTQLATLANKKETPLSQPHC